jgi:hypothetical protein
VCVCVCVIYPFVYNLDNENRFRSFWMRKKGVHKMFMLSLMACCKHLNACQPFFSWDPFLLCIGEYTIHSL